MQRDIDLTPPPAGSSQKVGYTFALTSSLGAGMATVVGKWNLEAIPPLLMNSLIFTVATVIVSGTVLPFMRTHRLFSLTRQGWLWLGLFTASSWCAIWAYWAGVQRMDPSLAAFLNRSEVPIAIALGIIFLKERLTPMEIVGMVLSLTGIVIMRLTLRFEYTTGFWLVLLGSVFFGLTEFLSKIAVRHVGPVILTYIRNLFLAVFFWLAFAISGQSCDGLELVWPGVIALGFLGPIMSRMSYLMALKRISLSRVAVISQSQPVFVILIALLVLGQLPTFREVTGGIFLTVGCILMIMARPNKAALRRI
ncbi:MAG: DMT family transporter [Anaerolineae bacterium]